MQTIEYYMYLPFAFSDLTFPIFSSISGCVTKFAKRQTMPQTVLIPFVFLQLMASSECRATFLGLSFITGRIGSSALPWVTLAPEHPAETASVNKIFEFI